MDRAKGRSCCAPALPRVLIHPSGWKGNSPKFAGKAEPYDCSVRTTRLEYVWCGEDPNERRSDVFEVQTIIGHGGPDDARSSGGARPPSDRCSKAARYAPGEFGDRGAGTGRP